MSEETFQIGDESFRPEYDLDGKLEGCRGPDGFERCENCVMQDICPMWTED